MTKYKVDDTVMVNHIHPTDGMQSLKGLTTSAGTNIGHIGLDYGRMDGAIRVTGPNWVTFTKSGGVEKPKKKKRGPKKFYEELDFVYDLIGARINAEDLGVVIVGNHMVPVRFKKFDKPSNDGAWDSQVRVFYDRLDEEARGAVGKHRQMKYNQLRIMRIDGVEQAMSDLMVEYMSRFSELALNFKI